MLGVDGAWGGIFKGTEFTEPGTSLSAYYSQGPFICALGGGAGQRGADPTFTVPFLVYFFEPGSHGLQASLKKKKKTEMPLNS